MGGQSGFESSSGFVLSILALDEAQILRNLTFALGRTEQVKLVTRMDLEAEDNMVPSVLRLEGNGP